MNTEEYAYCFCTYVALHIPLRVLSFVVYQPCYYAFQNYVIWEYGSSLFTWAPSVYGI